MGRRLVLAALLHVACMSVAVAGEFRVDRLSDGIFALVGERGQRSPANLGNNATFGLIVTSEGAILVDAGGSYKGAAELDTAISSLTDQPVKIVINSGGQDHRWLGNGYWRERGARIIASSAAVADQKARGSQQLSMLMQLVGAEGMAGTEPVTAGEVFDERLELQLGGVGLELVHAGAAHTPGDCFVHLPTKSTVFAGDIVFVDRLLGVLPQSSSQSWIEAFKSMAALAPQHVVPGHGGATGLDKARADTLEYLVQLRDKVRQHMQAGGDMKTVAEIDQKQYQHLDQFEALSKRNAIAVFAELEFE